uniref:Uncharacterized protein n=1 Tax=Glossina pallidipes TaxID=7398 RepID=A0A1B0A777_GLOPL
MDKQTYKKQIPANDNTRQIFISDWVSVAHIKYEVYEVNHKWDIVMQIEDFNLANVPWELNAHVRPTMLLYLTANYDCFFEGIDELRLSQWERVCSHWGRLLKLAFCNSFGLTIFRCTPIVTPADSYHPAVRVVPGEKEEAIKFMKILVESKTPTIISNDCSCPSDEGFLGLLCIMGWSIFNTNVYA